MTWDQIWERRLADLEHDLRGPLAVIRGEVELILSQADASIAERQKSSASVVEQVVLIEELLARACQPAEFDTPGGA